MTDSIQIEIKPRKINECQCCYSEAKVFVEHGCQHLICLKCQLKMINVSNRRTCLFCNPLNESEEKKEINTSIVHMTAIPNRNINAKNLLDCHAFCVIYTALLVCIGFLLLISFIRTLD